MSNHSLDPPGPRVTKLDSMDGEHPVDVDIPMMIAKVKSQEIALELTANSFFASPETLARMTNATAAASNWFLRRVFVRYLMEKVFGADTRRTLSKSANRLGV